MNDAKTTMASAARWLVILTTSLLVLAGSVIAPRPVSAKNVCVVDAETVCAASCGTHCTCCISNAPQSGSPAPIAPNSPTRGNIAKDFQLAPVLYAPVALDRESTAVIRNPFLVPAFASSTPLFVRHCTFLI